jgi:hypothetical protein
MIMALTASIALVGLLLLAVLFASLAARRWLTDVP